MDGIMAEAALWLPDDDVDGDFGGDPCPPILALIYLYPLSLSLPFGIAE